MLGFRLLFSHPQQSCIEYSLIPKHQQMKIFVATTIQTMFVAETRMASTASFGFRIVVVIVAILYTFISFTRDATMKQKRVLRGK